MNRSIRAAAMAAGMALLGGVVAAPGAVASGGTSFDLRITVTHSPDPVVTGGLGGVVTYTVWLQSAHGSATSTGTDRLHAFLNLDPNRAGIYPVAQYVSDTGASVGMPCSVSGELGLTGGLLGNAVCEGTPDIPRCGTLSFSISYLLPAVDAALVQLHTAAAVSDDLNANTNVSPFSDDYTNVALVAGQPPTPGPLSQGSPNPIPPALPGC